MDFISSDFDKLKKNSCELEGFIPQYKLLNTKFPDLDANQLILKYSKLENLCLELNKKIGELEDQKHAIEDEKIKIKSTFDRQADELMLKDINREKQMKMYLERLKEKEIEIKDADEYKRNYMQLYKKIQKIFIDWNSQIKVGFGFFFEKMIIFNTSKFCNLGVSFRKEGQWTKS